MASGLPRSIPRLRVILLESGVETVPRELWDHPQVRKTSERYGVEPGMLLLDKSLHYNAMASLPRKWKRGRPDIVHLTLLVLLESRAGRRGLVEVYMHTVNGEVYAFSPWERIPKNYERFKGLMAHLLRDGRVPPEGEALIYKVADRLSDFVKEEGPLILLWERGVRSSEEEVVARALAVNGLLGIGAFPRGDFERSTLRKAREYYSIAGGEPLPAWSVACRLVRAYEEMVNL
ncbi:MAG: 16S rRNA methyltransferase [Desulfurococcales archaeon]|nr:16S rRNA methyltransferase [Desulfurococcales archaeon]